MTNFINLLICLSAVCIIGAASATPFEGDSERDVLFQVSTIDALLQAVYDGFMPAGELMRHGDFGIGTFDGLDGEMVAVDGKYYQVRSDGIAYNVSDNMTIPFATVTAFDSDMVLSLNGTMNYSQLSSALDGELPTKNLFYAIRIDGVFPYVKVRAYPKQSKPYQPLANLSQQQCVFELRNVSGTIVGFYSTPFVQGLNVPGYHLHLLTADRKAGGHIMDLVAVDPEIVLDITPVFEMVLPTSGDFVGVDLSLDQSEALNLVERGTQSNE